MADQVDDTGLGRLYTRDDSLDRLRKVLQAVDDGDEDGAGAAVPEFVHHFEPEVGTLGILDRPSASLIPSAATPARYTALLTSPSSRIPGSSPRTRLDPERFEEHSADGSPRASGSAIRYRLSGRVGDGRDQIGETRSRETRPDGPTFHAARVHRLDLVVEAGKAR